MNHRKAFVHRHIWPITDAIRSAIGRFVHRSALRILWWQLEVSNYNDSSYPYVKPWARYLAAPVLFVLERISPHAYELAFQDILDSL
jgi:hypothetical protein